MALIVTFGLDELALYVTVVVPVEDVVPPPTARTEADWLQPNVRLVGCTVSGVGGTTGAVVPLVVVTVTVVRALTESVTMIEPAVMQTFGLAAVTMNSPGLWFGSMYVTVRFGS